MTNLEELKRLALAAQEHYSAARVFSHINVAQFCNAASPDTILSLISDLETCIEALVGLKHRHAECWCGVAIGNPMYSEHSLACKLAREALSKIRGIK